MLLQPGLCQTCRKPHFWFSNEAAHIHIVAYISSQSEIHQLERTRESMAKELVNLSNANEELQDQVKELPELREQYKVG